LVLLIIGLPQCSHKFELSGISFPHCEQNIFYSPFSEYLKNY
jgi:hypothetical protein